MRVRSSLQIRPTRPTRAEEALRALWALVLGLLLGLVLALGAEQA